MNKESRAQFLAIFSGIVLGAFSANAIADKMIFGQYLWILGALFGGMIAWIGVDARKFVVSTALAIKHAWRQTISWRPDTEHWKIIGRLLLAVGSASLTSVGIFGLLSVWLPKPVPLNSTAEWCVGIFVGVPALLCGAIAISLFCITVVSLFVTMRKNSISLENLRYITFFANPVGILGIYVVVIVFLTVFLWFLLIDVPFAFKRVWIWMQETSKKVGPAKRQTVLFLRRAIRLAFLYINTERRTPSLLFASIGASVGHLYGHVFLVAAIGAIIGVVEFEVAKKFRDRLADNRQTSST